MGNEPLLADAGDYVVPALTVRHFGFDAIGRDKPARISNEGALPAKAITGLDIGLHQLVKIGGSGLDLQG